MDSITHNETKLQAVTAPVLRSLLASYTYVFTAVLGCLVLWWFLSTKNKNAAPSIYGNRQFSAPIIGSSNAILGRWQFYRRGPALLRAGYAAHRDAFFKVSGHDILVVPRRYLSELAALPPERLSLNAAIADAFQNLRPITAVIADHSLQARAIAARLTPQLAAHVPRVQEQLARHLPRDLPATVDAWRSVVAVALARRMVHRAVATQFVAELAEDEGFMATAVRFSEHGFAHNLLLRVVPDWAKPGVAVFLPTGWNVAAALRRARRRVVPLIRERRRREAADVDYVKPDDFLQHLMDGAADVGDDADTTVQRLMVTYLGAGPSVVITVAQVLFDLCAHPEYVEPLREEVIETLRNGGYSRQALADMKKLDSFMRESQRLNPPTQLAFNTIVREPVTLHDGVVLPAGAHIQMAAYALGVDPDLVPDPERFDGLRQYNNRKQPGQENWHQFTTTSENNLHFGHGKIACPGRFFADQAVKMIVSNILVRYHLRFPGGATARPATTSWYDVVIPDLNTRVEFKLREDACEYSF